MGNTLTGPLEYFSQCHISFDTHLGYWGDGYKRLYATGMRHNVHFSVRYSGTKMDFVRICQGPAPSLFTDE